ncbi:ParB/RepB/Spo0J family partition protein [Novosphingobium resinovorum]|uniref:ParB/RepB/Spo0J family partition protein n=1 Tax=Novosphingobium resinovorum TaxID=158500 RepID=UPI001B3C4E19|nr:ParB/RepB/Spo0J family partition protein [Novosphingobium resinovorum]MBF7013743.1 ParB/RepB/Spo0J family partition protein [Novosphingobium sp. HR1a]WJM25887.1 ParB/RepB/Spo0J family partition protein [Novosphingobium resinovorum]
MNEPSVLVPAAQLARSPVNVRKRSNARADAELEASIAAHGLLQNLVGVPVPRKKGYYRVTAGGRRLDAIHRLIEKGVLPADHQVPILVLANPKDSREISLVENYERAALSPAEDCLAFRDLIEVEKRSPADIARRFGVEKRFVMGRLRLANLADPIFAALDADEITLEVAKAYASTADTSRQMAIWQALQGAGACDNASEVRRALKCYSYRADDPKALLVGREAYVAAGGRIEDEDLFSNAADERWIDIHILEELAEAKLAEQAEVIRQREGLGQIRSVASERVPYTETCMLRSLPTAPESGPCVAAGKALDGGTGGDLPALDGSDPRRKNDAFCDADFAAGATDVCKTGLESDTHSKAAALGYVVLSAGGTPQIHPQLFVAPVADGDGHAVEKADSAADGISDPTAPAHVGPVLDRRLREMLAAMKCEILALHVAQHPTFARDLGTFIMIDRERQKDTDDIPSTLSAPMPPASIHGFSGETRACAGWMVMEEALDRSWARYETIVERYAAFCMLDDAVKGSWLAWAVARTLHSVPGDGDGTDFLDYLGQRLDIDVAASWRPTALTFFDKLTKPGILSIIEQIGGAQFRAPYARLRKHDLAAAAERIFSGGVTLEPEIRQRALAWIPETMRFAPADADPGSAASDLAR